MTGARIVPIVVPGPLGGLLADKFGRRRLIIGCDAARMALMGMLATVAAAQLPVLLAPVIAAVATAAAAPYVPCAAAITPRMVSDADLPGANAVCSAVVGIGVVARPTLGGVLLFPRLDRHRLPGQRAHVRRFGAVRPGDPSPDGFPAHPSPW